MFGNSHLTSRGAVISQLQKIFPVRLSLLLVLATLAGNAFGQTLTTLYSFGTAPHDGVAPGARLIVDQNGNFFGVTGFGGRNGIDGTVFELSRPQAPGDPWTETILYLFSGAPNGKIPQSQLVMGADGSLVGTTLQGGTNGVGMAYSLAPGAHPGLWRKTVLHEFGSTADDIATPSLGLLNMPEGFYGADQGGANNFGAVYLLTPPVTKHGAWMQNILYSFQGSSVGDAAFPSGEMVRDANGNFYGSTAQGGVNNLGAVYEVSPPAVTGGAWTERVIYSFSGIDGTLPTGPLLLGPGGVLYGTTNGGGESGEGLVFELDPPAVPGNPWTQNIIHAFSGSNDGTSPENGVIADKSGRLYGTAGGTVFMLHRPHTRGGAWTETILHSFSFQEGFIINSPLTLFKNALYGTTAQGGTLGKGTVFKLTLP
jgi:uncharacterized repeat protein (TIGR03803 family)